MGKEPHNGKDGAAKGQSNSKRKCQVKPLGSKNAEQTTILLVRRNGSGVSRFLYQGTYADLASASGSALMGAFGRSRRRANDREFLYENLKGHWESPGKAGDELGGQHLPPYLRRSCSVAIRPPSSMSSSPSPDPPTYEDKPSIKYAAKSACSRAWSVPLSAPSRMPSAHILAARVVSSRGAVELSDSLRQWNLPRQTAAMGATFALTESVVANQRQKDDPLNGVAGGCAAGFLAGIRARSLPVAVASCAVLGAAVGTFDYSGKELGGDQSLSFEEKRRRFFKQPPSTVPAVAEE
ncbi:hypothetical protein EW146_g3896 [Bondarzewia mesenterica]|uniref:Uncharacterized protein n=1 Tax=Bondarzewia mesenterica TaxID=1095465 RepID=A0A4S4LYD8_9AGAM|nr:hypothetical protein EW146_g3896 [Bondarzewia mesenterica]